MARYVIDKDGNKVCVFRTNPNPDAELIEELPTPDDTPENPETTDEKED
jgi:hypothetical protein